MIMQKQKLIQAGLLALIVALFGWGLVILNGVNENLVQLKRPYMIGAVCDILHNARNGLAPYVGTRTPPSAESFLLMEDPRYPVVQRYERLDDRSFALHLYPKLAETYPDLAANVAHLDFGDFMMQQPAFCAESPSAVALDPPKL